MQWLIRRLLSGLAVLLPVAITASIVYWLARMVQRVIGGWVQVLLPAEASGTSVSVAVGLVVVFLFLIGLALQWPPVRALWRAIEGVVDRVPVVRVIYGASRDVVVYFARSQGRKFHDVVLVTLSGLDTKLVGLVTRKDTARLPKGMATEGHLLVFFPMSYQLGGYTMLVPRSAVEPLDMSAEEALRFTMMAGLSGDGAEEERRAEAQAPQAARAAGRR